MGLATRGQTSPQLLVAAAGIALACVLGASAPAEAAPPTCNPKTCNQLHADCGSPDNGCGSPLNCGTCPSGQSCDSSYTCVTSCTPKTCAQLSASCGTPSDGCGGTLSCGSC